MVSITVAICTALVLWRGAALILAHSMTVGELTVYLAYLTKFFKPVKDLATTTNAIAQATVGVERVRAILDTDTIIPEEPNGLEPATLQGEIEFEHVAFGYEPDHPDPHQRQPSRSNPAQFVGIVGPTGSGKSTVVSLIPRFYDVQSGNVLIDGEDVRDYKLKTSPRPDRLRPAGHHPLPRHHLREHRLRPPRRHQAKRSSPPPSSPTPTSSSPRMPLGYDTLVGERGSTLSGGQRQRIGIARVMVRNSPILLLDEPTAALDSESEKLVIDALEKLMKGKTVIAIAHRLSTIRDADQIIVVKEASSPKAAPTTSLWPATASTPNSTAPSSTHAPDKVVSVEAPGLT